MNVKELLLDNVRGRVREMLWNNVKKDLSAEEKRNLTLTDEGRIKFLYERSKYWYEEYEPLLKEMEGTGKKVKEKTEEKAI